MLLPVVSLLPLKNRIKTSSCACSGKPIHSQSLKLSWTKSWQWIRNPNHPVKLLELQNSPNHQHDDNEQTSGSWNTDNKSCNVFQNFYNGRLMDENDNDGDDCDLLGVLSLSGTSLPTERSGKHNFRLDLAYKGSDFCGWQRQCKKSVPKNMSMSTADTTPPPAPTTTIHDHPHDDTRGVKRLLTPLPSVQEIVEAALEDRDVRVAGRTDVSDVILTFFLTAEAQLTFPIPLGWCSCIRSSRSCPVGNAQIVATCSTTISSSMLVVAICVEMLEGRSGRYQVSPCVWSQESFLCLYPGWPCCAIVFRKQPFSNRKSSQ